MICNLLEIRSIKIGSSDSDYAPCPLEARFVFLQVTAQVLGPHTHPGVPDADPTSWH